MLKYPNDRYNGRVLLTDGNNQPYVPRFTRDEPKEATEWLTFVRYWRAWRVLMKRAGVKIP